MAQAPVAYSYPPAEATNPPTYSYAPQAFPAAASQSPVQPAPTYAGQMPPAYPRPGQPAYQPNPEELRTVFVTGFPQDVQERELNNLLRFIPGYEASQLNWKANYAQGFALFHTGAAAYTAVHMLNNLIFDDKSVLRCEIARKNMYIRANEHAMKRPRTDPYTQPAPSGASLASPTGAPAAAVPAAASPLAYTPVTNTRDNPPCSTLFVGNLGDTVSEAELLALFGAQPGFVTLKVVRNAKSATAFVEFADLASAMTVHQSQQGALLQTSDRGGLRIQYSKNPFGKKRDHQGNPVDPVTLPPSTAGEAVD